MPTTFGGEPYFPFRKSLLTR
ncbi:hypothetical protein [Staphylococcus aureus]